ncbi:hypothetical protein AWENTII_007838 [Aspergillus wentii]
MTLRIIIVGAGIAGLCSAIALRRAGHVVQIFEKSHFKTEIGAAVALAPNGVHVLEDIGFDFERARACRLELWAVVDGLSLDRIASQNLDDIGNLAGAQFWTIHRVDLHKELLKLALDEDTAEHYGHHPVKIHYGSSVRAVDAKKGCVFLEDDSIHQADLIIGADGINSTVRQSVVPRSTDPISTGMSAFRFLIPSEAFRKSPNLERVLRQKNDGSTLLVGTKNIMEERHMVWYKCRGGDVQNFVGIHPTRNHPSESGTIDFKSEMIEEFGHFNPIVNEMIKLADDVKCWPLVIHEPLESWVFNKVLLIGDAAHAMLPFGGQGANQAIEDAGAMGVLFKEMTSKKELPTRLSIFEMVRIKRASRVQILSQVRVGKEKEVEGKLRQYMEPDMSGDYPRSSFSRVLSSEMNANHGYSSSEYIWDSSCT